MMLTVQVLRKRGKCAARGESNYPTSSYPMANVSRKGVYLRIGPIELKLEVIGNVSLNFILRLALARRYSLSRI